LNTCEFAEKLNSPSKKKNWTVRQKTNWTVRQKKNEQSVKKKKLNSPSKKKFNSPSKKTLNSPSKTPVFIVGKTDDMTFLQLQIVCLLALLVQPTRIGEEWRYYIWSKKLSVKSNFCEICLWV